jgi:predicted permease
LEKIGSQVALIGYGAIIVLATIGLAFLLAKPLARNDFERRSYVYAFCIPNFGYFGYPLVEGVFGSEVLSQLMLFCLPMSIACNTFGYLLFVKDGKLTIKDILKMPVIVAVFIGMAIGLSGLKLPPLVSDVLTTAGNCMSPASMLLAGFVLGGFALKDLFKGSRSYLMSGIRLLGIPALVGGVLFLLGVREMYLALPIMILCMPLGLNLVVFPESMGIDASDNAKMCFVCNLLTIAVLPFVFALLSQIM